MSEQGKNQQRESLSLSLLGTLFVALKLLGKIDWSWWWVLAPFWLPAVAVWLTGLIILLVKLAIDQHRKKKKEKEERNEFN